MTHLSTTAPRAVAILLVVLAACGGGAIDPTATTLAGTSSTTSSTTTTPPVDTSLVPSPTPAPDKPVPSTPDVPLPGIPEGVDPTDVGYVTAAIDLLAEGLGVDPSEITVIGFEEVLWRNGSIGCPRPGMSYTQAIVDGTRVALEHDGDVYLFHAAGSGDPFLCVNPSEPLG